MTIEFTNMEVVGYIPTFLDENDPRPAKEQIHTAYSHGGGWNPFEGFKLKKDPITGRNFLSYPDDPPTWELSRATLRDETLIFFEHAWLVILQKDGSWEVARLD